MESPRNSEGEGASPSPEIRPDIMNDAELHTDATNNQNSVDEADSCRICRGEGSKEEPLFYPCKCSGSIRFVHQNCLMEWLSHSQKKYCELCKTPFRFTKLYHPHMPSTVPLPIFLRQAAVHTWKSVVTWSRFQLVLLVWMIWLPWCMRTIWRGLFWMGDGSWVNWAERRLRNETGPLSLAAKLAAERASPANRTLLTSKEAIASSFLSQISARVPHFLSPFRQLFEGGPLGLQMGKKLYGYAMRGGSNLTSAPAAAANVSEHLLPFPRSSWFSDVQFLSNLTRSTVLNNLIIDTLEGQLITILVVTAFVLVFLIREWVVQQQPNLNAGADLDAMVAAGQNVVVPAQDQRVEQGPRVPDRQGNAEPLDEGAQMQDPEERMIARARPRRPRPQLPRQGSAPGVNQDDKAADDPEIEDIGLGGSGSLLPSAATMDPSGKSEEDGDSKAPQRPAMPDRDMLARAAEIRRTLEEQSQLSGDGDSRKDVFKDLWTRADKMPTEVLKIIEREGRSDELAWIVALMNKVQSIGSASMHRDRWPSQGSPTSLPAANGAHEDTNSSPDHSEGDEGFVLLDKSPLTSSPEAESSESVQEDERNITQQDQMFPESQQQSEIATPAVMNSQHAVSHFAPDTRNQWDFSTSESEHIDSPRMEGFGEHDSTSQPAASELGDDSALAAHPNSNNNPFHPEYEGETPEASPFSDTATVENELPQTSETVGPSNVTVDSRENQIPGNLPPEQAQNLLERITNWLWGGVALPLPVEQPAGDDEHIVNDIANEAPFVHVDHGQPVRPADNDGVNVAQNPEVIAAAIQAGIDPNDVEAVEDIEDLEGILELVGMQGPIAGLVQNCMFCAVLVSLTILFGVWIPYISGKIFLVLLSHPVSLLLKIPLRWAASTADMVIDFFTFTAACAFYWTDSIIIFICVPVGWLIPALGRISQNTIIAETAKAYAESALGRLAKGFIATGGVLVESDVPTFSIVAHESLRGIEMTIAWVLQVVREVCMRSFAFVHDSASIKESSFTLATNIGNHAKDLATLTTETARSLMSSAPLLLQMNPLRVDLNIPQRTTPLDYDLAYWDTKDRALAVIFGYLFFVVLAVIYLHLSGWVRGPNKAGRVEGAVADALYQAGGVVKVVLIISIEMIAFPLYCGLLLDVALLPLFGNVTVMSRISFTLSSPYTSIFIHWFVGTCYMFHFALFVSMCRKILRNGVLFFIRDPDDPTFHPVRDVLERSVSTQLWKISFSALVYGGLVIICLGGVVWGIAYAFDGVLPIHWSSNEPVLEFPVDLLFYNFLMPLAVKFFKPSEGLNKMYTWWFRRCARTLRLTNFLFPDAKKDEEGRHVRGEWTDVFNIKPRAHENGVYAQDWQDSWEVPGQIEAGDVYLLTDGKYVRAPASDQVRIPKGARTFLEVDKYNKRIDGEPDPEQGLHGHKNEMFAKVYIPPFFRVRISIFIFLIWLFAATTGVSITIVPLVVGRLIFANMAPDHLRMNDIYAFSIGMYVLGGVVYGAFYRQQITKYIREILTPHTTTVTSFLRKGASSSLRFASIIYTYAAFGILLPFLLSLLMEFYLIIPLHTYFSVTLDALTTTPERHIIHLIQDWTLGVLYLKMAARVILYNTPSRPAAALRGIIRDGWLKPDVWLATRGFILPASFVMAIALTAPLALGWLANATISHLYGIDDEVLRACVYRYSYPGILAMGCAASFAYLLARAFAGWRKRVRDEVYLIGERLHNFGDSKRRKGSSKGKGKAIAVIAEG